uniref:Uncharacterized protein n=1 Tax=Kalanchoe fedtschenkoi TaxID=63787 RepID=A0A7N0RA73_KALFE
MANVIMVSTTEALIPISKPQAALFDFNLTLPIIMAEFLLLMFALDKVYYTPLGRFMDERDGYDQAKLIEVKDTSLDIKAMEEQMAAIMKAARAEITAALNKMKKETAAEVEQKIRGALANLEGGDIQALDSQTAALSDEIVKKVIPI